MRNAADTNILYEHVHIDLEIMCERMKPDNKCAFFYIIAIRLLCAEQAHISLETQGNNTQLGLNHL